MNQFTTAVSCVPGPRTPCVWNGATLVRYAPAVPVSGKLGNFLITVSYCDNLNLFYTTDVGKGIDGEYIVRHLEENID
jgi:hypothetical protein